MNCSKVENHIVLCRSKWQVLDRLADVILNESRLQLLTITQSRLVILYYRIKSTRPHDIEVIYLSVRITLLNQICKMGTDETGTSSDNIVHCFFYFADSPKTIRIIQNKEAPSFVIYEQEFLETLRR